MTTRERINAKTKSKRFPNDTRGARTPVRVRVHHLAPGRTRDPALGRAPAPAPAQTAKTGAAAAAAADTAAKVATARTSPEDGTDIAAEATIDTATIAIARRRRETVSATTPATTRRTRGKTEKTETTDRATTQTTDAVRATEIATHRGVVAREIATATATDRAVAATAIGTWTGIESRRVTEEETGTTRTETTILDGGATAATSVAAGTTDRLGAGPRSGTAGTAGTAGTDTEETATAIVIVIAIDRTTVTTTTTGVVLLRPAPTGDETAPVLPFIITLTTTTTTAAGTSTIVTTTSAVVAVAEVRSIRTTTTTHRTRGTGEGTDQVHRRTTEVVAEEVRGQEEEETGTETGTEEEVVHRETDGSV